MTNLKPIGKFQTGSQAPERSNVEKTVIMLKLLLIREVQKHDIIWKNMKIQKNKHLLEDAWRRVKNGVQIDNASYCERQWNDLVQRYRDHLEGRSLMHSELVDPMSFIDSELNVKKKKPANAEKYDKQRKQKKDLKKKPKCRCKKGSPNAKRDASVAIINHMFECAPDDIMKNVLDQLVGVLLHMQPHLKDNITEVALYHINSTGDVEDIDWSSLDAPAAVCQAVWSYEVKKRVLKSFQSK